MSPLLFISLVKSMSGLFSRSSTAPLLIDSLCPLNEVWYFAATNSKEKVFLEFPETTFPETKRGQPRKHPVLPHDPVSVQETVQNPDYPWETIVPAERSKGPPYAERKFIRCFSCRKDQNRNYVKPGDEVWLYLRKYADGEIKYFTSNLPLHHSPAIFRNKNNMIRAIIFGMCQNLIIHYGYLLLL